MGAGFLFWLQDLYVFAFTTHAKIIETHQGKSLNNIEEIIGHRGEVIETHWGNHWKPFAKSTKTNWFCRLNENQLSGFGVIMLFRVITISRAAAVHVFRLLVCRQFLELGGLSTLSEHLVLSTRRYSRFRCTEKLVEQPTGYQRLPGSKFQFFFPNFLGCVTSIYSHSMSYLKNKSFL